MKIKSFEALADQLDTVAKRHDHALIGPVVWYPANDSNSGGAEPDDRVWHVHVTVPDYFTAGVGLGICAPEPPDSVLAAFDTVFVMRRLGDATFDEAMTMRAKLIDIMRRRFEKVHVASTDLEAAQICARLWPSKRSEKLLREVTAETLERADA